MKSPQGDCARYSDAKTPYEEAVKGENDSEAQALEFAVITSGLEHPQVTLKSLVVGGIVGAFVSVLAMYYSLKIGVTPSLNVLAGVGGFMIISGLTKVGIVRSHFTVQENVVIQTCAVACMSLASQAGFGSGILGLTEAVYLQVGNDTKGNLATDVINFNWVRSFAWCASIALFGFFISFPLRRRFIIDMRLLFPSGTATAHMIKTLHTSAEAVVFQWGVLLKSGVVSYCISIFVWCFKDLGSFPIFGLKAAKYNWVLDFAPGTFAIPLMLPARVMYSILIGCIISWGIMTPWLEAHKLQDKTHNSTSPWFKTKDVSGLKAYYTFTAVSIICVDALYSIVNIAIILIKAKLKKKEPVPEAEEAKEGDTLSQAQRQAYLDKIFDSAHVPTWSWITGLVFFAAMSVVIISLIFTEVHWYKILVCCLLIPIFAIGIVQGVGMTDWNISSAVGKLILFIIGSWSGDDKSVIPSLLMCQMVIVGCSQAADLMQDFKTGYLVGASATSMIKSQIIGACLSCLIVPSVWVIFNNAFTIPGEQLKAPYGEVYRVLAITATSGLSGLPKYCGWFMLVGALYTIIFNLYIDLFTTSNNKYMRLFAEYCPVPMPVAIGMIVPAYFGLEGAIVMIIVYFWKRSNPALFEKAQYILAAGMLTGEGFSVLTQIIVSIGGGVPPIALSYAENHEAT
ncbi:metal-nicotianamine transporter YSL6-like isoform 1 [Thraustotheca clavata]|uniref:Metal-nicotianamine transporter YSL6-like isoform 1 n=1 Tax=Thraustotheca clavata TaxID=74557 RepID=A0A1V9Z0H6_9STRA|nr:metal-nicotianamine transporter YSL6-like isoform 1 [Thraustotheca clavata]